MHAVWLVLHAGGAFPPETRLWSSQYNPETKRTRIDPVEFPVTTWLSEVHEVGYVKPDLAVYEPQARSPARLAAFERLARYARDAFTGAAGDRPGLLAQADGGILFLDEVQDLPKPAQRKLVRVFQDRKRRFRPLSSDEEQSVDVELVSVHRTSTPPASESVSIRISTIGSATSRWRFLRCGSAARTSPTLAASVARAAAP